MNRLILMLSKRFAVALFAVAIAAVSAFAQGGGKTAVYVSGGESAVNKVFATDMSHALDRTGRFSAIERQRAFFDAVSVDSSVAASDSLIIDRAKQDGAEYVCFVNLDFALGSYLISARIVDAESGEIVTSGVSDSPLGTLSDLRAASVNVIRSLRGLRPPPESEPTPPVSEDLSIANRSEPPPAPVSPPEPQQPKPEPAPTTPAPPTASGVDMTGSISEIVRSIINETVGKKFGQAVGNAISDIVVGQVNGELAKLGGNVSANDNIGSIVGKVVEQTVTQEIAKRVPGPAGRLGGSVGKAVGQNVERAVNDILSGRTPSVSASSSQHSGDGGRDDDFPKTRMGLRLAWNASRANVDIDGYNDRWGWYSFDKDNFGHGFEMGLVLNTMLSPMLSFDYGVNFVSRQPINFEDYFEGYAEHETALTFPALLRLAGRGDAAVFMETGFQFDFTLHRRSKDYYLFDRRRFDVGYVLGAGIYLGRNVALTNRLTWGLSDYSSEQRGKVFQNSLDVTFMFKERPRSNTAATSQGRSGIDPNTVVKGTMTDSRDGKTYKTVTIGNQTWMAENLNYETSNSWCYANDNANCDRYGRLYDWRAAMNACPADWHLPSDAEWIELTRAMGANPGTKLKTSDYWRQRQRIPLGTNDYGFSALPGGDRWDGNFDNAGNYGLWWSATEDGASYARYRSMRYNDAGVNSGWNDKSYGFSVRCLRE